MSEVQQVGYLAALKEKQQQELLRANSSYSENDWSKFLVDRDGNVFMWIDSVLQYVVSVSTTSESDVPVSAVKAALDRGRE
ncbi:MAG: hypothetical protein ABFQ62_04395 [Patescibacteria group bacterium]